MPSSFPFCLSTWGRPRPICGVCNRACSQKLNGIRVCPLDPHEHAGRGGDAAYGRPNAAGTDMPAGAASPTGSGMSGASRIREGSGETRRPGRPQAMSLSHGVWARASQQSS